jgi:autotransporter-associated beta strand protein
VAGALAAGTGATISPGGTGAAGTLTFSGGLTENGDAAQRFEISSPDGTNDQIVVSGDLNLNGANSLVVAPFPHGTIATGTYKLITYSGALNGSLANLQLAVSAGFGMLTNPPGEIDLIIIPPPRTPTNLVWVGDSGANAWDFNASTNWESSGTPLTFLNGDSVTFDDSGAAHPGVSITGTLLPASVTVDASSDYTLTGAGEIRGLTGLVKTNSGTLTIDAINSYTGPTMLEGGVLQVSTVVDAGMPSPIGAASGDSTNLWFNNAVLRYAAADASGMNRGMMLSDGGGTIDVTNEVANLTLSGVIDGSGALTKAGLGTLTLTAASPFTGGTVISNGMVVLGSNNGNGSGSDSGLGINTSPVTLYGGTLQLYGYAASTSPTYNSFRNPLVVPGGATGTLQLYPRASGLYSTLTGAGTLNLVVNYLRDDLVGDWSAFAGIINVTPKPSGSGDEFRIHNSYGYGNATLNLNDGVTMDTAGSSGNIVNIGALNGTSLAIIGPGNKSSKNPTWVVGWNNTACSYDGSIQDDGVTSVIKVGTGTWTLTGQNNYSGSTIISNGVLALATGTYGDSYLTSTRIIVASGATLSVSGLSSGTMYVPTGQTLGGSGNINGILDSTGGGTIVPGDGTSAGTLTVTGNATLGGTFMAKLHRGGSPNCDQITAPAINLQYVNVIVTNMGPNLQVGDSFKLFNGAVSGAVGTVTLPSPDYYTWDTSQLAVNGTISVTAVQPPPTVTSVDASALASGSLGINASGGMANGPVVILSSTNLALPLSSWTELYNTNFDASGNLNATVPVDSNQPDQYFMLRAQ